jgi:hypothetical protein
MTYYQKLWFVTSADIVLQLLFLCFMKKEWYVIMLVKDVNHREMQIRRKIQFLVQTCPL